MVWIDHKIKCFLVVKFFIGGGERERERVVLLIWIIIKYSKCINYLYLFIYLNTK